MRHLGLAMVMWPVLQGCTALDRDDSFTIRRDSAGVRIVEARQPAWGVGDGWQIDPEPLLDLTESGMGDPHNFYQVRGMRRLPDGSIVVANAGSREVRLFSPEGSFLGSIGGPGEGPGEFANMQQLEIVGDSMFVLDYDGRVTVFGPAPALVRAMRFHHGVESIQSLGDGSLVAEVLLSFPDPVSAGVLRTPLALLRLDLEGTRLDSIGETAGSEEYTDNVSFSGTPLFSRRAHVATHDGRIFYGASDLLQVQELAPNGEIVRIFRIPDYPLALTDEQVQAERDARLNVPLPEGMTLPPQIRQAIEAMPSPATRPAYSDLIAGASGAIWLRPFVGVGEGGGPTAWLVLDAGGAWLGGVEVPAGFRIWEIGMDEILGTWVDEVGVQHPQVLRLRR